MARFNTPLFTLRCHLQSKTKTSEGSCAPPTVVWQSRKWQSCQELERSGWICLFFCGSHTFSRVSRTTKLKETLNAGVAKSNNTVRAKIKSCDRKINFSVDIYSAVRLLLLLASDGFLACLAFCKLQKIFLKPCSFLKVAHFYCFWFFFLAQPSFVQMFALQLRVNMPRNSWLVGRNRRRWTFLDALLF